MATLLDLLFPDYSRNRAMEAQEFMKNQAMQALNSASTQYGQFQPDSFDVEDLKQVQSNGLWDQGLPGLFDFGPGQQRQSAIQGFGALLANPMTAPIGQQALQSYLPQAQEGKPQVVELPTGEMAQDGKTPMMQKFIVDLNSGGKYPIGPPAPRGEGVSVNIDQTKAYTPAELSKMRTKDGTIPPLGTTPEDAKSMGIRVIEDISPEEAGKRQSLADAYRDMDTLRGFVFDDKGVVNRQNVANMAIGTPFTKGRTMTSLLRGAISAKVKAETGATANEEEIKDMMVRFNLSVLDDDATIVDKMNRLQDFMSNSLAQASPELYNKLLTRSNNPPGVKTWKDGGYEYRQFPDGRTQRRKL